MKRKKIILALALALLASRARAQTSPNFSGPPNPTVPTAGQWNALFAGKQDYLGASPCLTTGCNATGFVSTGTPPTITGTCGAVSQFGGATAGIFTANGSCTGTGGTYILTFTIAAPTGWACDARDRTTPADTVNQTASSVSSATFAASTANNDVVQFKCIGY